ncbi:MAG: hypothetical protein AAF267_04545 [Deinococcota bacterium]
MPVSILIFTLLTCVLAQEPQVIAVDNAAQLEQLTVIPTDIPDPVYALATSADGQLLAAGIGSSLILWDISTLTAPVELARLEILGEGASDIAFANAGNLLVVGDWSGRLHVVRLENPSNPSLLTSFQAHSEYALPVAFSPDDSLLVSFGVTSFNSYIPNIHIWDVEALIRDSQTITDFYQPARRILATGYGTVHFEDTSNDDDVQGTLIYGSEAQTITVKTFDDNLNPKVIDAFTSEFDFVDPVSISSDGRYVVAVEDSEDNSVLSVWDVTAGDQLATFASQGSGLASINPAGTIVAEGGYDGVLYVWDARSGDVLARFTPSDISIEIVSFSREGRVLVSGDGEGILRFWAHP